MLGSQRELEGARAGLIWETIQPDVMVAKTKKCKSVLSGGRINPKFDLHETNRGTRLSPILEQGALLCIHGRLG